jgi:uncharacterized protein YbcI
VEVILKTQGAIEVAICEGLSRFKRDYMGRSANDIQTNLIGNLGILRLEEILTAAE